MHKTKAISYNGEDASTVKYKIRTCRENTYLAISSTDAGPR